MITIELKEHKKLNEEFTAFVSFDYNAKIVNVIRALPFKFYHADITSWEIPINKIETITSQLQDFDIKIIGKVSLLQPVKKEIEIPEGFEFKTKPFSHQLEGFEYGLKYDRWFLGDEMGLGKTKQTIDIAVARKQIYGYKHCLIVCGVNTLKWNWVNEVHTHSNEEAYILGQRTNRYGKIKIGSTKDKLDDLAILKKDQPSPYFIITNVETFRDKNIADTIKKLVDMKIINMCIADEAHKMKNPTAQQTKGFLKCLPDCRIIMTGTPLMNSPMDLYIILKWLGYETHAFTAFKSHYCVMGGYGGYEIVGYKNMDQLTAQVKEIMLRRLKDDVLDLPEKTYVEELVEMTDKQSIIYKEVEMDIKANIDMVKFDNNPIATLIRLRQATGWTGILSSDIQESAKMDRLEDLVDECVTNGKKVIIFSNWTQMTSIIMKTLKRYNPVKITGETDDSDRQSFVYEFQNKPECKVIVGTIGAMGTGITLTAATTIIFFDEPWNKALFDQAVDRAHRIGQKNNITIYSLMCKDTIDERIHNIIYKKGAMSDALIDGKGVMSREVFDYLLG